MQDTQITVHLNHFDGPLALLLHLVQKDEVNIKELELNRITQQYLDYLNGLKELNFDVAGDYLYMAATLLHLKSERSVADDEKVRKLLEKEDFEITSKEELIRKLEQLQAFQKMGERLWQLPKKGHDIFLRPKLNRKALTESLVKPTDSQELIQVMIDWVIRNQRKFILMKRDRLSIKEKLASLRKQLITGSRQQFTSLIEKRENILEVVITFISLLELARLKKVELFQAENRSEIYVDVVDDLQNFDVDQANGFDDPDSGDEPSSEELLGEEQIVVQ